MNMKKLLIFFTLLFVLALSGLVEAGDNIGKAAYIRGLDKDSTGSITQNISMVGAVILGALNADLTKPGFGFLNDPDTGMGQDAANSISFMTGGNWHIYLSTVGLLINVPLTIPTTSQAMINFNGDATTGFGRKSAGKPDVWSSNVEVFFWDSLGAYLASTTASSSDFAVLSRKEIENKVAAAAAGNSLLYYLHETPSPGFTGYESLTLVGTTTLSQDISVAINNTTWTLIDQWVTATGSPNITNLRDGRYDVRKFILKENTADLVVAWELYKMTPLGVETFIASSAPVTVTGGIATYTVNAAIIVASSVDLLSTDLFVLKEWGHDSGPNTSVRNQYGGAFQPIFNAPIDSGIFMRIDASNASLPDARTFLDVYSKAETIALTGGGGYVGNEFTFDNDYASQSLPLNVAAKQFTLTANGGWSIDAKVSAKLAANNEYVNFTLHAPISSNGGAPYIFGASSTLKDFTGPNVASYDCFIGAGIPGFWIVASGPNGSIWKVNELKVGGN